jgi:L-seryl-tRNA(Ser) seleniumtransferase
MAGMPVLTPEEDALRRLPQVDAAAREPAMDSLLAEIGRGFGVSLLREALEDLRREIRAGLLDPPALARRLAGLPADVERRAAALREPSLRSVINATGVVVHTNLGRALLSPAAQRAVARAAGAYSNLEFDLEAGGRGSRLAHLERALGALFPGHAGLAVNNNAAVMLLALNTLARGREVIVSRGELVEIGGSFRIPEILERSGAVLREVGTTNRTRLDDYARAIHSGTGALLKVHPSNYRILGFTEETSLPDLAALARERALPLLMDQGSGNLIDLGRFGVAEPPVAALLSEGADLVLFSGDKLLGGPQAGLAVGAGPIVGEMRRNPLSRALRLDKLSIAALDATLLEYVRGTALAEVPVLRMIAAEADAVAARARRVAAAIRAASPAPAEIEEMPSGSVVGGGAWPLGRLPTTVVALRRGGTGAGSIERRLRAQTPPIIARVEDSRVLLDLRTVLAEEEAALTAGVVAALREV